MKRCFTVFFSFISTLAGVALLLASILAAAPADSGWPMLAHDESRSGATPTEVRPPFERKWYRLFLDEGLMAGVQPVIAGGKVFVGTLHGLLHAIDDETGKDVWTFKAGGPILHTCAVGGRKDGQLHVFFGAADGKIYAVHANDGKLAWTIETGAAVWNAPVIHEDLIIIGSRDAKLYAVNSTTGKTKWTGATGGPLLCSPAIDARRNAVYLGSEDMREYAFDLRDGKQIWRSEKLPGVSLRGYHPVIAPDGSVMVTVAPAISLERFQPLLLDMVKEIFGDFASWRHKKEENAKLREENFKLMARPETYEAQLSYLRKRLTVEPFYQTFFVIDPATGKQKFVTPVAYSESMNGPGAPAVVTSDGKVILKYQVLLRSRYEHYSPFLNVGYLNTSTGQITPIMDQSRTYGWHDSLLLVHDEQSQLSVGGRVLFNTHQDNVNAMDLDTLKGFNEPLCQNIHEPQKGEAMGIWSYILRGQPIPVGKEWLARGTAGYGGGSVIDVPISVAGDSFYYVPTHEINSGAAVIAYKMQPGGTAGKRSPTPAHPLNDEEWKKVQNLPWDWDTLALGRLNHVLAGLPGKVPGTRQQPLTNEAAQAVAKIADAELEKFIWQVPVVESKGSRSRLVSDLRAKLAVAVTELIATEWRPLVFPAGKHPEEAYRFFNEPTETLYTIAIAYPHLDDAVQRKAKAHVETLCSAGGMLEGGTGQRTYQANVGAVRSAYDAPPEKFMRLNDGILRSDVARLYPLWLWAHTSGDWTHVEKNWKRLRELADQPPNKLEEDCRNGHVAGLIAYCRIARHMNDESAVEQGVAAARKAMRERLTYEFGHARGGLILQVPVLRSIFARWEHLTPEVARLCSTYAGRTHRHLMDVYVDYHRPTWWLAWNVETMMRNECPLEFPTMSAEVFAARALILREPAEQLERFIDLPWCKGDELYVQKIVQTLNAAH